MNISKPESECRPLCGQDELINSLSKPVGYACSQCIIAGEEYQILNAAEKQIVRECMEEAKANGSMIYQVCKAREPTWEWSRIFQGHMSHFLVECKSRRIDAYQVDESSNKGGVCMPYYGY